MTWLWALSFTTSSLLLAACAATTLTPTPTPTPPKAAEGTKGISGRTGLVVSQALRIGVIKVFPAGLGTVNDEGTGFTIAARMRVGSKVEVQMTLINDSGEPLIGEVHLQVPPGFRVTATPSDQVNAIARSALDRWKFTMAGDAGNLTPDIALTIRVPSGGTPGFSAIQGTNRQVSH